MALLKPYRDVFTGVLKRMFWNLSASDRAISLNYQAYAMQDGGG